MESDCVARNVQVCILAGGASRRMGRAKSRLEIDGEPLVERLAARFAPCTAGVWIVAKPDSGLEDLGWPLVYDAAAGRALVHGIAAALRTPGPAWRFLLACDMPRVDARVLDALLASTRSGQGRGAAPVVSPQEGIEPLPSLWRGNLGLEDLEGWGLTARDWVRRAGLIAWQVPGELRHLFANVNTPLEWSAFEREERQQA